jgi:chemotaxis protein CheD
VTRRSLLPLNGQGMRTRSFETTGMVDEKAHGVASVFLRPGDWFFGAGPHKVSTMLGSCISVVMWSPRLSLGAMCHCLLPARPLPRAVPAMSAGHYVDEALDWMAQQFHLHHCAVHSLDVALVGGATAHDSSIGASNVRKAQAWLDAQGVTPLQIDVGGRVVRRLSFGLADGALNIAHGGRLGPSEV